MEGQCADCCTEVNQEQGHAAGPVLPETAAFNPVASAIQPSLEWETLTVLIEVCQYYLVLVFFFFLWVTLCVTRLFIILIPARLIECCSCSKTRSYTKSLMGFGAVLYLEVNCIGLFVFQTFEPSVCVVYFSFPDHVCYWTKELFYSKDHWLLNKV